MLTDLPATWRTACHRPISQAIKCRLELAASTKRHADISSKKTQFPHPTRPAKGDIYPRNKADHSEQLSLSKPSIFALYIHTQWIHCRLGRFGVDVTARLHFSRYRHCGNEQPFVGVLKSVCLRLAPPEMLAGITLSVGAVGGFRSFALLFCRCARRRSGNRLRELKLNFAACCSSSCHATSALRFIPRVACFPI